jgi:hypothetical protein
MDQRTLRSARGAAAIELLLLLPVPLVALMLMLAAYRVVAGTWATAVASRLAAWSQRVAPGAVDGDTLLPLVRQMSGEISAVRTEIVSDVGSVESFRAPAGGSTLLALDILPSASSRSRQVSVRASTRTGAFWGGTQRTTTVLVAGVDAADQPLRDDDYRTAVEALTFGGVVGLGRW